MSDSQKWLFLVSAALVAVLLYALGPVLSPFLIAVGLAYLGNPLVGRLERCKLSRTTAVVIVFAGLGVMLLIALVVVVPLLQQELEALAHKAPGYIDWLQHTVLPWVQSKFASDLPVLDLEQVKQLITDHWQQMGGVAASVMSSVGVSGLALLGFFANLVLIPVLTFYLMRDWELIVARVHELIPRHFEPRAVHLARECDEMLGAFMHGQLLVMGALGLVYSIGLWIVGLDLALIIGMIAGLANFVPYLGFILGIVLAGVAAIVQFQEIMPLLYVLLVLGIGQMLESFVLTPYLLGDRIGLHPVIVIFAVMAGGQLFGFIGMLLALPVAAVIMVMLRQFNEHYLNNKAHSGSFKR
jgi:predicted PurR-regulated permease PerM